MKINVDFFKKLKNSTVLKIVIAAILILAVFFAVLNYKDIFRSDGSDGAQGEDYIYSSSSTVNSMQNISNGILLLCRDRLVMIDKNGDERLAYRYSYDSPAVENAGDNVLVYNRGGTEYTVINGTKVELEKETRDEIITASVSENGDFALATSADGASSKLELYDGDGEQTATWTSSDEYITHVELSDNRTYAAVAAVTTENADILTNVHVINYDTGDEVTTFNYPGDIVIDMRYNDNGILEIVTDSMISKISRENIRYEDIKYDNGSVTSCNFSNGGELAVCVDMIDSSRNRLISLDKDAENLLDAEVGGTVNYVCVEKNETYVLANDGVTVFDKNGEVSSETKIDKSSKNAVLYRGFLYVLNGSGIVRYEI